MIEMGLYTTQKNNKNSSGAWKKLKKCMVAALGDQTFWKTREWESYQYKKWCLGKRKTSQLLEQEERRYNKHTLGSQWGQKWSMRSKFMKIKRMNRFGQRRKGGNNVKETHIDSQLHLMSAHHNPQQEAILTWRECIICLCFFLFS